MRIDHAMIRRIADDFEDERNQRFLRAIYRDIEENIDRAQDHNDQEKAEFLTNLRGQVENPDFWMTMDCLLNHEYRF